MAQRSGPVPRPPEERFWEKVDKNSPEGCWLWTAGCDRDGYGHFQVDPAGGHNSQALAHRYAYELLVGPIPEGLTLDHLCRVHACVKAIADERGPAHLEPVTTRINTMRSPIAPGAINARKTHCKHGHPFDEVNTLITSIGGRRCRICFSVWKKAYKERAQNVH